MTIVRLLVIAALLLLMAACTNSDGTEPQGESKETVKEATEEKPDVESVEEPPIKANEPAPKLQLFADVGPEEIPSEKVLVIDGIEYPSNLVHLKLQEFGFYVPEILEVYTFEDGARIGQSRGQYISVEEVNRLRNPDNIAESLGSADAVSFKDEELSAYKEYAGSSKDESGVRNDAFLVQHQGVDDQVVSFRYFEKNKDSILPVFLEVARHIKYIGTLG